MLAKNESQGIFLIPMPVLVRNSFMGDEAIKMQLFRPWKPPKRQTTAEVRVAARFWQGCDELPSTAHEELDDFLILVQFSRTCLRVISWVSAAKLGRHRAADSTLEP